MPEHIGTIIKDEVENTMLSESGHNRYLENTLKLHVLTNMEANTELLEDLLRSYPFRVRTVKNPNGCFTDY